MSCDLQAKELEEDLNCLFVATYFLCGNSSTYTAAKHGEHGKNLGRRRRRRRKVVCTGICS
jgi:hypothetical protein